MDEFRTKTGRCVFDDGEVRLEPDVRMALLGYDRTAVLLGLAALAGLTVIALFSGLSASTVAAGVVFGAVLSTVGLLVNVYRERSRIGTIPVEQIQHVTVREGRLGTLAPRFVIKRDARKGAAVRFVMMHSIRFSSGRAEFERGKELFREHGLDLRGTLPDSEQSVTLPDSDDDDATSTADDTDRTFEDIVDDVPETDGPAGLDYERYQRTRDEDEDDDPPDRFGPK